MATFAYTARDAAGRSVRGTRAAGDEGELRRVLRADGILLVRAKVNRPGSGAGRGGKIKTRDLVLFTFNLQNVVDSGVPLLSGLGDMHEETRNPTFRRIIGDIVDSVTSGETLTQALSHHPNAFDSLYVNMVDAGEQSGQLPEALGRVVQFLEWQEEFRRQIKELTSYPIIVMVAMVGLVGLVVGFVFPRFASIFEKVSFELPMPTRILIGLSDFITAWWLVLLIGGAVLWASMIVLLKIPRVRLVLDGWWLKVPVIGDLIQMLNFSQVSRGLSSFIDTGIPIPHALEMIARIVPNRRVSVSVSAAREAILGGQTLSGAFKETKIFPPLVLRMVSLGEQSGRIVEALSKAAAIYDREIPVKTKRVLGLINPLLTFAIGGMLMFVILAVMMPLYGMYQQIGTSY